MRKLINTFVICIISYITLYAPYNMYYKVPELNLAQKVLYSLNTETQLNINKLQNALAQVESSNNDSAINKLENAVGLLQIRTSIIKDINKKLFNGIKKYKYSDRFNKIKSKEIFVLYQYIYNPKFDMEIAARIWNGGPTGAHKKLTAQYWIKVQETIKDQLLTS